MSRRKSEAFKNLVTGVFMVVVLALLVYFTVVISGVDIVTGRERVRAVARFAQVGGLKDHDAVMYRGTKVGTVERIELVEDGLLVRMEIDRSVRLRSGCGATVCSLSLLGGNYLLLEEGEGGDFDLEVSEIPGESPTDWMRDLARITRNLDELTSSAEIRSAITNVNAAIASVRSAVSGVEESIGDAKSTMASIRHTFDNASEITDELKSSKVVDEIRSGLAEFKSGLGAFKRACDGIDFSDSKADVRTMVAEVKEVIAGAKRLMETLNEVSGKVRDGDSTVGRLLGDADLYREVEGLVHDCRQVLDNYRDTTPISTFSSLATGAL